LAISKSTSTNEREILTMKRGNGYLKVDQRTINTLTGAKPIAAVKVISRSRSDRTDINSWIKQHSMAGLETSREQEGGATGQRNNGERQ